MSTLYYPGLVRDFDLSVDYCERINSFARLAFTVHQQVAAIQAERGVYIAIRHL
jgi:hypothetical protein